MAYTTGPVDHLSFQHLNVWYNQPFRWFRQRLFHRVSGNVSFLCYFQFRCFCLTIFTHCVHLFMLWYSFWSSSTSRNWCHSPVFRFLICATDAQRWAVVLQGIGVPSLHRIILQESWNLTRFFLRSSNTLRVGIYFHSLDRLCNLVSNMLCLVYSYFLWFSLGKYDVLSIHCCQEESYFHFWLVSLPCFPHTSWCVIDYFMLFFESVIFQEPLFCLRFSFWYIVVVNTVKFIDLCSHACTMASEQDLLVDEIPTISADASSPISYGNHLLDASQVENHPVGSIQRNTCVGRDVSTPTPAQFVLVRSCIVSCAANSMVADTVPTQWMCNGRARLSPTLFVIWSNYCCSR